MKLKEQVKRLFLIWILILVMIATLFFAFFSSRMYRKESEKFSQDVLKLNMEILDRKLNEIQEIQRAIVNDRKIREILKYRTETDKIDYAIELYNQRNIIDRFNLLLSNLKIENAYIVNRDGELFYSFKNSFKNRELSKKTWFNNVVNKAKLAISYMSEVHTGDYLLRENNKKYISLVMPFTKFDKTPTIYFVCDIAIDNLIQGNVSKDINYGFLDSNKNFYLIDDKNIYEYNFKNVDTLWKIKKFLNKEIYRGKNIVIVFRKSKIFGFEIYGIKELTELEGINYKIFQLFLLIIVIAVIFSLVISNKISEIIDAPMRRLIKNCKLVSTGNYNIKFEIEKNYEINLLSRVIENMINNIVFLNNKITQEQKKIVEEKLRTLQHQINPHFINNILQSIKGMAISGENEKISYITTLLGKIMAYSVYQPYNEVKLKDEIEHITNYLKIQNIRFDNKIIYSIECEEHLLENNILKLTLQPLLENSIEHGIKSLGKGIISITVEEEKNSISIIISDNGVGFSQEKLKEMQENLKNGKVYSKDRSIGILNVDERIKKRYGQEYGVEVISKKDVITTVIIKLPKSAKGEEYEDIDCR